MTESLRERCIEAMVDVTEDEYGPFGRQRYYSEAREVLDAVLDVLEESADYEPTPGWDLRFHELLDLLAVLRGNVE